MYLRVSKNNGRDYLTIIHSYRDSITKKSKSKQVMSLGYLDELKKQYDDPIAHFKEVVRTMNEEESSKKASNTIRIDLSKRLGQDESLQKNLGYAALSKIGHELGINCFFNSRSYKLGIEYSLDSIMKLLVYSRILSPGSKKKAYEGKGSFFESFDFSLTDVYRSLSRINSYSEALQLHLHRNVCEQYGRSTDVVYYDVTNYYFEIGKPTELLRKGVSKEHRPNPIVQMGLFVDNMGLPISYGLFPGNTNDCLTLVPMLAKLKRDYGIGRTIVVADKGLNTSDNIIFNTLHKDGYVYSQKVRGASKEFIEYALEEKGYRAELGKEGKPTGVKKNREHTLGI